MLRILYVVFLLVRAHLSEGFIQQKISATTGNFVNSGTYVLGENQWFGNSVAKINGNFATSGTTHIAVGVPRRDTNTGGLWILGLANDGKVASQKYLGNVQGFSPPDELQQNGQFGRSVASRDLNGDGTPDLVVGAPGSSSDSTPTIGAVFLIWMNTDKTVNSFYRLPAQSGTLFNEDDLSSGDRFGTAVAVAGDINNDSYQDLLIGAPNDDDGVSNAGAVYVLLMRANGVVFSKMKISKTSGNFTGSYLSGGDQFGYSISPIGDRDGNGVPDFVVGAPRDDTGGIDSGAIYFLFMNSDGTVKFDKKLSAEDLRANHGTMTRDQFGSSVSEVGDLNGDGFNDIAVGAAEDDDGYSGSGAIYMILLGANCEYISSYKISALHGGFTGTLDPLGNFGSSVANVGDLDGDGIEELAVGAPGSAEGSDEDAGSIWITSGILSSPSSAPTSVPSSPSIHPSSKPSPYPSLCPSSTSPSSVPSSQPSSSFPTAIPSYVPTAAPFKETFLPTSHPSVLPSTIPSKRPTTYPSSVPSSIPSSYPSQKPSSVPLSSLPSAIPSTIPSTIPLVDLSATPTKAPVTSIPSAIPSPLPSSALTATSIPSSKPSTFPSSSPTAVYVAAALSFELSVTLNTTSNCSNINSNDIEATRYAMAIGMGQPTTNLQYSGCDEGEANLIRQRQRRRVQSKISLALQFDVRIPIDAGVAADVTQTNSLFESIISNARESIDSGKANDAISEYYTNILGSGQTSLSLTAVVGGGNQVVYTPTTEPTESPTSSDQNLNNGSADMMSTETVIFISVGSAAGMLLLCLMACFAAEHLVDNFCGEDNKVYLSPGSTRSAWSITSTSSKRFRFWQKRPHEETESENDFHPIDTQNSLGGFSVDSYGSAVV